MKSASSQGDVSLEMRFPDGPTRVDAVLIRPLVGRVVLTGADGAATALLTNSTVGSSGYRWTCLARA